MTGVTCQLHANFSKVLTKLVLTMMHESHHYQPWWRLDEANAHLPNPGRVDVLHLAQYLGANIIAHTAALSQSQQWP